MGSTGFVTDQNGELYEHVEYFPFGESWVQEHSNTQRTPYLYTGKELDDETGLYYYGARYYDPRTSVWVSADPILEKYLPTGDKEQDARLAGIGGVFNSLNIGLYTYAHLKPNKLLDPDGNSTWINENNDVEVVINDSDLSIYKLTSSNVQKVGETYFWDSFTRNGDINPSALGHINTGRDITSKLWQIADRAKTQNYIGMALDSRDGKPLDIKASIPMASKHKAQEGFLFQGKYISLRDGGNILYGINMSNQNLTRDAAMRGAGGWAQEKSMFSAAMGQLGKEYGPAPYFGEDAITGTRIDFGFSLNGGYHPPPGHLSDIAAP
jgi:RHS repeat-associated protein